MTINNPNNIPDPHDYWLAQGDGREDAEECEHCGELVLEGTDDRCEHCDNYIGPDEPDWGDVIAEREQEECEAYWDSI